MAVNHILLVEDDCDLANITKFYLTHAGYTVDVASSCAQATELLNRVSYQVVLLDSVLPDGRGNSLCPLIREKDRLCPILFLSCLDDSESIVSALELGGDDYMVKPVKHLELLARIQPICASGRFTRNSSSGRKNRTALNAETCRLTPTSARSAETARLFRCPRSNTIC